MIEIKCPHCYNDMAQLNSIYSWLDGKPIFLILYFKCPNDEAVISISLKVTEERRPK